MVILVVVASVEVAIVLVASVVVALTTGAMHPKVFCAIFAPGNKRIVRVVRSVAGITIPKQGLSYNPLPQPA